MKLGPFVLPHSVLLLFAVMCLAYAMARYFDHRNTVKLEPRLTQLLIVAILAARLFFVWRYRALYLGSPLSILDVRDGGWDAQAGLIAAWVYALLLVKRMPPLRKGILVTVGIASVAWLCGSLLLFLKLAPQGALPVNVLQDLQGKPVALSAFRGKPTVVNFWATWCPPCQREMPAMQKVQASRPDVNIVFLNQGESAQAVEGFLAAGRLQLKNVLLDRSQAVAKEFAVLAYPTTLFFDASGKLVYQHMGPLSEAPLIHHLEQGRRPSTTAPYLLQ